MGVLRMGVLVTGCPKKNPYDSHSPKLVPKLITGPGPELDKSTCFTGFQSECKAAPGPPEIAPGVSSFDQSNMFQLFNLRVLSILMSFSTFIQLSRFFLASSIVQQIKIIERKVSWAGSFQASTLLFSTFAFSFYKIRENKILSEFLKMIKYCSGIELKGDPSHT